MSSRVLMAASAVFLFGAGLLLNFAPQEIATLLGVSGGRPTMLQILAGSLMGMGVINWMWKGHAVGGIYGRPIGLGNLLQFAVGAMGLGRAASAEAKPVIWGLLAFYVLFALWFGVVVFGGGPRAR
jgi:hypothetical protein